MINLAPPLLDGKKTLEEVMSKRRSVRNFDSGSITMEAFSTLCWAGQGITSTKGRYRAAPSAGALYPIFLYAALGETGVENIGAGVYLYNPEEHALERLTENDVRRALAGAALGQMWMSHAAVMFIVAVEYPRITRKYGDRGILYAHYEAGHVAQNILLEAVALDLAGCEVGAFDDYAVMEKAGLPDAHEPLLIISVGHPGAPGF